MSRQTTLGRFGFEKSISQRNSVMETKVLDFFQLCPIVFTVALTYLFEISASALFLKYSKNLANVSLDIVIKYIFKKECISRQLVCFIA